MHHPKHMSASPKARNVRTAARASPEKAVPWVPEVKEREIETKVEDLEAELAQRMAARDEGP